MSSRAELDSPSPLHDYPSAVQLSTSCPPTVYLTAVTVAWGACLFGYDSSYIGSTITLVGFQDDFGLTGLPASQKAATSANIIAVFQAGAFFGAMFGFPLMERFGRKIALQVSLGVSVAPARASSSSSLIASASSFRTDSSRLFRLLLWSSCKMQISPSVVCINQGLNSRRFLFGQRRSDTADRGID